MHLCRAELSISYVAMTFSGSCWIVTLTKAPSSAEQTSRTASHSRLLGQRQGKEENLEKHSHPPGVKVLVVS